jgi:serine O-acetyltransferase
VSIAQKNGKKAADIGDNVRIYANACLLGDINVGNNAIIGAGAVVTKDVPENAVVAGNPAKVIKYRQ